MDARAPWYLVGPLLGLLVVGLRWTINRPLGALGGFIDAYDWVRRPTAAPGWRLYFLLGIVAGGFLYSLLSGGFHPASDPAGMVGYLSSSAGRAALLLGGGLLMGYGARTSGGCTSGHGICGTALGSPASYVATMTFMAVAVAATHAVSAIFAWSRS